MTTTTTTTTALVPTTNITELLSGGSLVKVLDKLKPIEKVGGKKTVHILKKVELSDRVKSAVERFPTTIEKAVTPTERRALSGEEVIALLDEREDLDLIEKVIKERKEAQRVAIFNHHDVTLESTEGFDAAAFDVSDDGWYIVRSGVGSPKHDKGFVRQVQDGTASLTAPALEAIIGQHGFTKEDYLACTTAVRVLDEAKVMLHLRKRPEIVEALRQATVRGNTVLKHALGKVGS